LWLDSAATFQANYASLVDQLHDADPGARIFCQSPILRTDYTSPNNFGNVLGDYRTAISTVCGARPWTQFVDGTTLLSPSDLAGGLHPSTQGEAKYAAAIISILNTSTTTTGLWSGFNVNGNFSAASASTTNATTTNLAVTGDSYFAGNLGIGTTTPGSIFSINGVANWTTGTSTLYSTGGINLSGGCFAINGTCVGGSSGSGTVGSGTQGQFAFYNAAGTSLTATSTLFVSQTGNIGVGTSSPGSLLSIANIANFAAATSTFYSSLTTNGISVAPQTSSGAGIGGFFVNPANGYIGNNPAPVAPVDFSNTNLAYNAPSQYLFADAVIEGRGLADISSFAKVSVNAGNLVFGGPTYRTGSSHWNAGSAGADGADAITLDFGSSYPIDAVVFGSWDRVGCTLGGVAIDGSNDGVTWTNLGNPTYHCAQIAMFAPAEFGDSGFGSYRYLRISYTVAGVSAEMAGLQVFSNANGALSGEQAWGTGPGMSGTVWRGGFGGVSIGTTTAYASTKLALQGDTTDSTSIALQALDASGNALLTVVDNGRTAFGTTTPYSRLEVWGPDTASTSAFAVVNSASTTEFTVYDTGNAVLAGSLTQNSDQRLKTNISDLDASSSLAEIDSLNPVTFNWIDPAKSSVPQFGFIAQQVQQVFPNLISTTSPTALTPDGTLSLNYIDLISPIVAAIQELDSEFNSLASTVANLADSFTTEQLTFNRATGQQLCLQESDGATVCVNGDQLAAVLASANQSGTTPASPSTSPSASTATDTPPVIQINGDNPATIQIGASYADLGATITGPQADLNLGIETYLNGVLESSIELDTSAAATDTIAYVVIDSQGLTSTSTRIVIVEPAVVPPAPLPAATSSSATSTNQ
jgi:hypothetical protein